MDYVNRVAAYLSSVPGAGPAAVVPHHAWPDLKCRLECDHAEFVAVPASYGTAKTLAGEVPMLCVAVFSPGLPASRRTMHYPARLAFLFRESMKNATGPVVLSEGAAAAVSRMAPTTGDG